MDTLTADLGIRVAAAVASADDPEMPGVSIVDLGLFEQLQVDADTGRVWVGLVPTFTGCPALDVIGQEVTGAVASVEGVTAVEVEFLAGSLEAATLELALVLARENYARRAEGHQMWVVDRRDILTGDDEFLAPNADKPHRHNDGTRVAARRKAQRGSS